MGPDFLCGVSKFLLVGLISPLLVKIVFIPSSAVTMSSFAEFIDRLSFIDGHQATRHSRAFPNGGIPRFENADLVSQIPCMMSQLPVEDDADADAATERLRSARELFDQAVDVLDYFFLIAPFQDPRRIFVALQTAHDVFVSSFVLFYSKSSC